MAVIVLGMPLNTVCLLTLRVTVLKLFYVHGTCIFICEDHVNNQRDATFYALYW